LDNKNIFYQFRPISRTTDYEGIKQYKDIERLKNCELYFSPLKQLNDPLDGKIHFNWNGENNIWKGMMYHYTNLLFTKLSLKIGYFQFAEKKVKRHEEVF